MKRLLKAAALATALVAVEANAANAQALATLHDAHRGMDYVLDGDAVRVSGDASGHERRVELPGPIFADPRYACPPAMIVDASGAIVVSSNIAPILWRIEPGSLTVRRFDLQLDSDRERDVGFSGLAIGERDGTLIALAGAMGSLWKVQLSSGKAEKLAIALPVGCGRAP